MKKIELNKETYAILVDRESLKEGAEWFGEPFEPLQAQRVNAKEGKVYKAHFHILNPRIIKQTQESFVVISGKIAVDIYDLGMNLLGCLEAGPGEVILSYRGGHGIRVLEDSIFYEFKAGQYTYVSEDKEFFNGI